MTQVIHGLTREQLLKRVFGEKPENVREREESRVSAGHQPVKRG